MTNRIFIFSAEILWLEFEMPKAFETTTGVLRVFVGYCGNTKSPQPIQH